MISEGSEHLTITTGKITDFSVVQLAAGEEKNIEIRENSQGFEFGLSVGSQQNQKEYMATMFDAQEVDKGKLIKVSREASGFKASIVLTIGTEQALSNKRTKHYREADRINRKYKIDKAVEITLAAARVVGQTINVATGGQ